jgi:hypothetical protein
VFEFFSRHKETIQMLAPGETTGTGIMRISPREWIKWPRVNGNIKKSALV